MLRDGALQGSRLVGAPKTLGCGLVGRRVISWLLQLSGVVFGSGCQAVPAARLSTRTRIGVSKLDGQSNRDDKYVV